MSSKRPPASDSDYEEDDHKDDDDFVVGDADYEEPRPKAKKKRAAKADDGLAQHKATRFEGGAKGGEGSPQHKATRFEGADRKPRAPKPKTPKPPTEFTPLENNWFIDPPSLIYKSDSGAQGRTKVAAMDLDGTIILRKSVGTFQPVNSDDWRWFNADVPAKLAALHDDGYSIVVFSNQGGIKGATLGVLSNKIRELVDKVLADLRGQAGREVPVQVLIAPKDDAYRKPGTGMWEYFVAKLNAGVKPDMAQSFFVGDAAGRDNDINNGSASDLQFAAAAGLDFKLPEDFFGKGGAAAAPASAVDGNAAMAAAFSELAELVRRAGGPNSHFKATAAAKTAATIADFPSAITSSRQLKGVPGVGKSSLLKIDEFLASGTLAALAELKGEAPAAPADPDAEMAHRFLL